jgi:hypothetical protein
MAAVGASASPSPAAFAFGRPNRPVVIIFEDELDLGDKKREIRMGA